MGITTTTKIAIIATSRNMLAHVYIDNNFLIINFLFKNINKSIHEINTSFHQKTSWVEEHCYELLHNMKTY